MMKYALAVLLGVFVAIWEVAIRGNLPANFALPMLVPVITLLTITSRRARVYATVVAATVIISLFQLSFDLPLLRWVGIAFLLEYVSRQWLTNRSLYSSVMLVVLAQMVDWASHMLLSGIAVFLGPEAFVWSPVYPWLMTLVWDALLIVAAFLIIAGTTRRFSIPLQHRPALGGYE